MNVSHVYEYEERAFFEEGDLTRIQHTLDNLALSTKPDNKTSYFFVLPDVNVSLATSSHKTVVKYKGGQLGRGNGFEEHEFPMQPEALPEALQLFSALLKVEPQVSEQFRINYNLGNSVEVALKYTQMWGFHLEFEKVYSAANEEEKHRQEIAAHRELTNVAERLGVTFIGDEAMERFKEQCSRNIPRGAYDPEAFKAKSYAKFFNAAV